MKQKGILIAALSLLAVGLIGIVVMVLIGLNASPTTSQSGQSSQSGSTSDSSSIGRQIYLTGIGSDGSPIPRRVVAGGGSMMAARNGCSSCHGTNGHGGTLRMMASTIEAPDITYKSLKDEGFTDATIGQAIRNGLDENGKNLDSVMPRWQMSDTDLKYLITYLKELSAQ